jgi:hypothetical protein
MLIVNPEERVNINDVVKYCQEQIAVFAKREVKSSLSKNSEITQDEPPVKRKF